MSRPRTIAVVGAGYVGLTTAACLSHLGHLVRCYDVDVGLIADLRAGHVTIREPRLEEMVREGLLADRLRFYAGRDPEALEGVELVFVCVGTPPGPDGLPDLTALDRAAYAICRAVPRACPVVVKSTVPVGTCRRLSQGRGRPFVSNPEFLREGRAVHDWMAPDRVVIGTDADIAGDELAGLYDDLGLGAPVIRLGPDEAEMVKLVSNAFLAARLSMVNTVADLCEMQGMDAVEVLHAVGKDHRIGLQHMSPGPGWGGSCLPKDTAALADMAREVTGSRFVHDVVMANGHHYGRIMERAESMLGEFEASVVALWGLTFKAGTNDLRSSPAMVLARLLDERGVLLRAHDPAFPGPLPTFVVHCLDPLHAAENADLIVVATEWPAFADADLERVGKVMHRRRILDLRGVIDPAKAQAAGFEYRGWRAVGVARARASLA